MKNNPNDSEALKWRLEIMDDIILKLNLNIHIIEYRDLIELKYKDLK